MCVDLQWVVVWGQIQVPASGKVVHADTFLVPHCFHLTYFPNAFSLKQTPGIISHVSVSVSV